MSGEHKPRHEDLPNPNGTDSVTPEETASSSKAPPIYMHCSAALSEHRGTGTERFSAFAMVNSLELTHPRHARTRRGAHWPCSQVHGPAKQSLC